MEFVDLGRGKRNQGPCVEGEGMNWPIDSKLNSLIRSLNFKSSQHRTSVSFKKENFPSMTITSFLNFPYMGSQLMRYVTSRHTMMSAENHLVEEHHENGQWR